MASAFFQFTLVGALVLQLFRLGSCDYCTDSLALSSCPTMATYDQIDLSAYGGLWYEIGSTANFKNVMEAGGVCAEARYTMDGSSKLKVVNSNFITATPMATVAVGGISASSSMACEQGRLICHQISADDSLLKEGLSKLSKFQSDISSSYPTEASQVSTAASKIQQAAAGLAPQIDQLSKYVTQVQIENSQLSQTDGDASSVVASIKSSISLVNTQVSSMGSSYQTITDAQLDLINVAKGLFQKGGAAISPSLTLTDAATEILGGATVIQAQVVAMSTAFNASSEAASAVLTGKEKPFYNVSSISGSASVNGSAGKLSVTFEPLPGKIFPGKYWILAVDGASNTGYNAALVYSCNDVLTGGADQSIWILSRNPSLSKDVTSRFLSLASSMGITQSCDAPFVYTVRSSKCPS